MCMFVLFKIKLVQTNHNVGPRMFRTREEVARRRVGEHGVGSLDGRGGVERGPRVGDEIHVGVAVVVGRRVGRRELRMRIESIIEDMMDEMKGHTTMSQCSEIFISSSTACPT